ncbi:acriflavin resistance protein [Rhodothermaceae bacterium RA]|nr:acriflavin resistance protein [Rhodothermaceae bacterium RA]
MCVNRWIAGLMERPVAVLSWAVALLLMGGWAAFEVPLEWVPRVELPEVRLTASWPGASPRQVERYVTAPIERAVQTVPGTEGIESLSREGMSTVILRVADGTDLSTYITRVGERLTLLRGVLPEHVHPRLTRQVPEALRKEEGFMTLQLVGVLAPDALRRIADERLAPVLRSLEGVAEVRVEGGTERELLVTLDPDRLDALGVTPAAVRAVLAEATKDAVYGRLRGSGRALLLSSAEQEVEALRRLVVRSRRGTRTPIRLADVASVAVQEAPRRSISRIDGQPVVTLTVDRARDSHMLAVAEAVRARLAALRETLPEGVRLLVADDRSEHVRDQLHDLAWRGGLGLMLLVLILLVMLRSTGAVATVLFSVAVALAVALALLVPFGLTLNLITLAGLVLVFGLLVDNSVVIAEHFQRGRLQQRAGSGLPPAMNAGAVLQAVWVPLLGGTLSTMAVMVPLVYLSGELQALFRPFGVLVGLTLLASLLSAAVLIPVLVRWWSPRRRRSPPRRWPHRVVEAACRGAARFPRMTLVALALLLGIPLWLLPDHIPVQEGRPDRPEARLAALYNATLGAAPVRAARTVLDPVFGGVLRPFFREVDFGTRWDLGAPPEVNVHLAFPPGTPIEQADSLLQRFERTALAFDAVARTLSRIQEHRAILRVQFTPAALNTFVPYRVREQLIQQALWLGGIEVSVGGLLPQGYSSGSGMSITGLRVEMRGASYDVLETLVDRFARHVRGRSRRVAEVNTNASRYDAGNDLTRDVLRFRWDAEAQARTGSTAYQLAEWLRPSLATRIPAFYADLAGEHQIPVRLVIRDAEQMDVDRVMERPFVLGDSTPVHLAGLLSYQIERRPAAIERVDQQYRRYVSIDYRGPYPMAQTFVEEALASFAVPAGYQLLQLRPIFFTAETRRTFGGVVLATVALVFLITAAVFESWRLPLVVLLSVPMALVGVSIGFLSTGIPFAEGAFIGTVLLVGIAVNDSILLVDGYRGLRRARPHRAPGILVRLALRRRLRPMWTTTMTSVAAMLPLVIIPGGDDFWEGLAVTVIGGLLASTLLAPLASVALLSRWSSG